MTDLNVYELLELFLSSGVRSIYMRSWGEDGSIHISFEDEFRVVLHKALRPSDDMRQFRQLLKAAIEQAET